MIMPRMATTTIPPMINILASCFLLPMLSASGSVQAIWEVLDSRRTEYILKVQKTICYRHLKLFGGLALKFTPSVDKAVNYIK